MGSSSRTDPRRRSYGDHVRPTPRLPEATVLDLFRGQVDSDYACALRYLGRNISRRDLDWVSDELARALFAHGVTRDKRVVAVHNVPVFVAVALIMRKLGAVLVPFVSKLPTTDTGRFPCRHRRAQSPAVDAAL